MRFFGLFLVFLSFPFSMGFLFSQEQFRNTKISQKAVSISVINVSDENLEILENTKKSEFIKLENISNFNFEQTFFRSISLLEENGALLFDLQKYQNIFIKTMIDNHEIYDFSKMDLNKRTFFWNKTFKFK